MSSISGINQASLTALSAMDKLGQRLDQIATQVASGVNSGDTDQSLGALTELPQVGIQMKANLLVLSTVQDLAKDLIQQPRKYPRSFAIHSDGRHGGDRPQDPAPQGHEILFGENRVQFRRGDLRGEIDPRAAAVEVRRVWNRDRLHIGTLIGIARNTHSASCRPPPLSQSTFQKTRSRPCL